MAGRIVANSVESEVQTSIRTTARELAEKEVKELAEQSARRTASAGAKAAAEDAAMTGARGSAQDALETAVKRDATNQTEASLKDQAGKLAGDKKTFWEGLSDEQKTKIFKGLAGTTVGVAGFITYWQLSGKSVDQAINDAPKDAVKTGGGMAGDGLGAFVEKFAPSLEDLLPDVNWTNFALIGGAAVVIVGVLFVASTKFTAKANAEATVEATTLIAAQSAALSSPVLN
jgi:hypothetical protein